MKGVQIVKDVCVCIPRRRSARNSWRQGPPLEMPTYIHMNVYYDQGHAGNTTVHSSSEVVWCWKYEVAHPFLLISCWVCLLWDTWDLSSIFCFHNTAAHSCSGLHPKIKRCNAKRAITYKDCHSKLVVKDCKKSQKAEKVVSLQSSAEGSSQTLSGLKQSKWYFNTSACIVYSLPKASLTTWIQVMLQMKRFLISKGVKINNKNSWICAMFYSTVSPELKATVFNKDKIKLSKTRPGN